MLMKKLMLALLLMIGGIAVVNAQDTTNMQTQNPTVTQDQDRTQIQVSELPEAVQTALASQDYSGWTVATAYRTTQKDTSDETKSMEVYAVELKNGAEVKTVKFDKDGNRIEDDQNKDDQK
jgi:hypothetical protein